MPKGKYRENVREGNQTKREMWRCLGSLELLPVDEKNVLSSRDAVANKDGTYTVRFNCGKDAVNNLQSSEKVFGFAWRVYGSSYKVKSGRWNPINSLVKE